MKKIYFLFLMALLPLVTSAERLEINGINYDINPEAKTAQVISGSNYTGDIVIPKTITFKTIECKVTSIGSSAFSHCSSLTSITIPNSVTSIGSSAFYNCTGLTSVTIPNSVTSIGNAAFSGTPWYNNQPNGVVYAGKVLYKYKGTMPAGTKISIKEGTLGIANYAFSDCSGLTSVTIPNSVINMGQWTFYACTGLTSVTIPNSVTTIDESVFYGCSGLTSVTIPNSVTSIGFQAFEYCSGLTSVSIPNSVTTIAIAAFRNCSSLTSVTIPNSVARIEGYTFRYCNSLATVILGNGINYIGYYSFADCGQLTDFYCFAENMPSTGNSTTVFDNSYINYATLHVPTGSVEAYKATSPWSEFGSKVAIETVKVKLNKTNVTLAKGKTVTLKATITPSTFPDKSMTWKSSNTAVATVTADGMVTGVKAGTATITCTSEITGKKATCKVTVVGVSLSKSEAVIEKNKTLTLKATVSPSTFTDKSVTWKSSNTKIATVSSSGNVTGVKAGTATITCTSTATGASATCKVTVYEGKITLNKTEAYVEKGKTMTLKATLTPTYLSDKSVTWKSSDKSIATVSSSGEVKGVKYGTVTITCTSKATGASATCKVTVGKVVINMTEFTLKKSRAVTLIATVYPTSLTDKSVTWKSSDKSVATVTSSGKVKGIAAGTATITCTSVATGLKGTCTVTVLSTSGGRSIEGDGDDVTGIETIEEAPVATEPYDVYDLSGRKVLNQVTSLDGLPEGIYIVNGKKILKKQ